MNKPVLLLAAALLAPNVTTGPAWAHDGEDHSAPAAVTTQTILPRASATTDDFELVAVLEDRRLLIHLDRAASNQPVPKARVEVEGAGPAAVAPEVAPGGVYALALAQPLPAGPHALTFTVQAADAADLLTATLLVPAPAAVDAAAPAAGPAAWAGRIGPGLAGGLVLAGLAWIAWRRRRSSLNDGTPE
jgi:hypothetical protein